MSTTQGQHRAGLDSVTDPFARSALRFAFHVRRFALFYVCGTVGAVSLAAFPIVNAATSAAPAAAGADGAAGTSSAAGGGQQAGSGSAGGSGSSGGSYAGGSAGGAAGGAGGAGAASGSGTAAAVGGTPGSAGSSYAGGGGPLGSISNRAGSGCAQGQHQIPWSSYADLCVPSFSGTNGGSTAQGVTASTISIAVRKNSDASGANALANDAENQAAGGVSDDTNYPYIQGIVKWMNGQFELYGRQVKLDLFSGQGNGTDESLDQGQAAACADADTEANSMHVFGAFNWSAIFESGVFADCAARYHIYIPEGAPYFPESWYAQRAPYVWGITMNCTLISDEVGEWLGKQIAPYPTKWAANDGVLSLNGRQRKFAVYVPNNAEYQQCVQESLQIEEGQYHIAKSREDQYNYALDISTFPQDAQKAIIQFAANDDTTVVLACDPVSPIFMTQDAVQQNYYPEWALIGVAGTDTDSYAQLWDQKAIDGHLWGLSQLASTQVALSPTSDAGRGLAAAGVPINISSVTDYYELLSMFNQLQAAGPDLTAARIAAVTPSIPTGTGPFGTWDYGQTHTAIIDSRQIYWNGSTTSLANGKEGTYVAIYDSKRFSRGTFPTGQPPYYP